MFRSMFNYDSPFWRFMGRLGDLMLLNFLWMLCSLPVISFGASTTALYYCMIKIILDEDNGMIRMFFKSFRQNFRQATVIWLILFLLGGLFTFDFYYFSKAFPEGSGIRIALLSVTGAFILLWGFVFLYVWPLLSRYENTIARTLMNSAFLSLRCLGRTILILVMDAAFALLFLAGLYIMPFFSPLIFLLGLPSMTYMNALILLPAFRRNMESGSTEDEGEGEKESHE